MKAEPTEALKYRAKIYSCPIGETGDYDSCIELVTPDFNLQCYDPDVDFEQVEELAELLNKGTFNSKIKQLEWVEANDVRGEKGVEAVTPFGNYEIYEKSDCTGYILWWVEQYLYVFPTEIDAKMFAQADFERKVGTCLISE